MNDVETRLRDALAARAAGVTHEPDAYAAVVARRSRRGTRGLRALGAATAAVAVLATVAVVVRVGAPREPVAAPGAGAPETFVALVEGEGAVAVGTAETFVSQGRPPGYADTAVAAFGDGRRYLVASIPAHYAPCVTDFAEVTARAVPGGAIYERADAIAAPAAGMVVGMAVSADGRRLAYTMQPRGPVRPAGCGIDVPLELRVRDLATGRERVWTSPPPRKGTGTPTGGSVSWSPDGRYIAVGATFEVVDTADPSRALRPEPDATVSVDGRTCELQDRAFRGNTGELVGYLHCGNDSTGVHVLDGDTATRLLFAAPGGDHRIQSVLAFDRSGDHALLSLRGGRGAGRGTLYRWDRGSGLRKVDIGDIEAVSEPAW